MDRFHKKFQQLKSDQGEKRNALRDFKELSEEERGLKKNALAERLKQRSILCGLLFLLALSASSFFALGIRSEEETPESISEGAGGGVSLDETITTSSFFQAFIEANFGEQAPERLNTIKVSGLIEKDGADQEFVLYKKQPDMALLNLVYDKFGNMTLGMDGDIVWQKIEAKDGSIRVNRVKGKTAKQIKTLGNFFSPFVQYALTFNGLDPKLQIIDRRRETGLIEVTFTDPYDGRTAVAQIDSQSLRLLRVNRIDENGESSSVAYKEYKAVNDFQIPRKIEFYDDGVVTQSIRIDKAATNTGIISEVFKIPNQLGSTPES